MFTELILAFKKVVDDFENSGSKNSDQQSRKQKGKRQYDDRYRLRQLRNRNEAAALTQSRDKGLLLNESRQSANLKSEVVNRSQIEIANGITQPMDEIPVFGLRASLQHPDNQRSFEIWKVEEHSNDISIETHVEPAPDSLIREEPLVIREVALEGKPLPHTWDELSVQTALKLIDNEHTPADVLLALAGHHNAEVRAQLIDNPNLPVDAIYTLMKDENADVRYSLAESYKLDLSTLEKLTEDSNPYVSARAQATMQRLLGGNVVHNTIFGSADVIPLRARA